MIDRRSFIFSSISLPMAFAGAKATTLARAPYVSVGEHVDSIVFHLWDKPRAPSGPVVVDQILPWDGIGYPLVLSTWNYGDKRDLWDGWYDYEWSNFRRDVPDRFWAIPDNNRRYPNVHAYVREKRFGEHPEVMRATMARNARVGPPASRPVANSRPKVVK